MKSDTTDSMELDGLSDEADSDDELDDSMVPLRCCLSPTAQSTQSLPSLQSPGS